jgi:hypothetical protein
MALDRGPISVCCPRCFALASPNRAFLFSQMAQATEGVTFVAATILPPLSGKGLEWVETFVFTLSALGLWWLFCIESPVGESWGMGGLHCISGTVCVNSHEKGRVSCARIFLSLTFYLFFRLKRLRVDCSPVGGGRYQQTQLAQNTRAVAETSFQWAAKH